MEKILVKQKTKMIRNIALQYNNIRDVQSVGEALKTNHTLTTLDLQDNVYLCCWN